MKSSLLAVSMLSCISVGTLSAKALSGNDYLVPQFSAGQTYSNVFSIMRSIRANGYDEHAGRNGGSADYTVISSPPDTWRFHSVGRYDGQGEGDGQSEHHDGGRIVCAVKDGAASDCQPYLEASGLVYNPTLWGTPPPQLVEGMHWQVQLKQPWELGGQNGTETVTVIHVDPKLQSVTLMREGTSDGAFSEGEAPSVKLTHAGATDSFDITPGKSHWKGYTTFVKGIVYSDELLVTRQDTLHDKSGKTLDATERRIMLLNAAPFPTL